MNMQNKKKLSLQRGTENPVEKSVLWLPRKDSSDLNVLTRLVGPRFGRISMVKYKTLPKLWDYGALSSQSTSKLVFYCHASENVERTPTQIKTTL